MKLKHSESTLKTKKPKKSPKSERYETKKYQKRVKSIGYKLSDSLKDAKWETEEKGNKMRKTYNKKHTTSELEDEEEVSDYEEESESDELEDEEVNEYDELENEEINECDEIDDDELNELDEYHEPENNEINGHYGLEEESESEEEESNDVEKGNTDSCDSGIITSDMIEKCQEGLISGSRKSIYKATQFFHAVVVKVNGAEFSTSRYNVVENEVVDDIITMCVIHLQPAVAKHLNLRVDQAPKMFDDKFKNILMKYFSDLLKIIQGISADQILRVMLKHLYSFCLYMAQFLKLSKVAIKMLSKIWSTSNQTVSALAYLSIVRLCGSNLKLQDSTQRLMYIDYVKSVNFVSKRRFSKLNFTKQTLAHFLSLNCNLTYKHAFFYIRQLAILLRNAITKMKEESLLNICNWQYVNSLRLWVETLSLNVDDTQLQQLWYPLIQIIIGCFKKLNSAKFLPFRIHCLNMLIKLEKETGVYIPVLSLIIEILTSLKTSNSQGTSVLVVSQDFDIVLRASSKELQQGSFLVAVLNKVSKLLLEYTALHSHRIYFPELVFPLMIQLKTYIKNFHHPIQKTIHFKIMLDVLNKIKENANFISDARNKVNLKLSNQESITAFEMNIKVNGTVLNTFSITQQKTNDNIAAYTKSKLQASKKKDKPKGGDNELPADENCKDNFDIVEKLDIESFF